MAGDDSLSTVFLVGAVAHIVFALVFVVLYGYAIFTQQFNRSAIAGNSIVVAIITQAVYWVQFCGLGAIVRSDNQTVYYLEWIGYSFSLFLIAKSLALFLQAPREQELTPAYYLLLVGVGGVLGTFISSDYRGAQWAVLLSTTAIYVIFFVELVRRGSIDRWEETFTLVYFIVVTLLTYVLFYVLGTPVYNAVSSTAEHWAYLIGNLLSKFVLPILEFVWFRQTPRTRVPQE